MFNTLLTRKRAELRTVTWRLTGIREAETLPSGEMINKCLDGLSKMKETETKRKVLSRTPHWERNIKKANGIYIFLCIWTLGIYKLLD